MRARAFAKVNLALRVGGVRSDGFHELSSLSQSIDLHDTVELIDHGVEVDVSGVPTDHTNLALAALEAVSEAAGGPPTGVRLTKRIPTRAGLAGGSADAAAALGLGGERYGMDRSVLARIAPGIGSDVPFCLVGGSAIVSGRGEVVESLDPLGGFALGVVVPPLELSTAAVFAAFDGLGPGDPPSIGGSALPPPLRDLGPLRNDLYRAAVSVAPGVADWRSELESRWGRPVAMSGSGSSLFAYFTDWDEAASACDDVPVGARLAIGCTLMDRGWAIER
ncbi:MAG: 4-(cytidine 5'-diphospho)-2-C-methyl-D-erythritol kinase [Acidimicrobiia bacterium]|nr:4-(cytidine 5'-diphospho)-2-C-methyl-D-erythritol kinase [Acidimicrobiia bacterium]